MNIEIRVDPSRTRRWQLDLLARLGRVPGLNVSRVSPAPASPAPSSLEMLLTFESLVQRRLRPHASDRIEAGCLAPAAPDGAVDADVVLDLSYGEEPRAGRRVLRPLFDGSSSEDALFGALLDGRMPVIEVEEAGTRARVARGVASSESANGIGDAMEAVTARLTTMLIASVQGRRRPLPAANPDAPRPCPPRNAAVATAAYLGRSLAFRAVRALYRLCCHAPHWRVGWRFVDGADVWDTRSLEGPAWTSLPDPGFRFFADPFPFVWRGRNFIFFEDLDHRTGKGVISTVEIDRNGPVGAVRTVLEEPWHLSYPFLIEHDGEIWMIPESSANRDVAIYRAREFPYRWERHALLLSDLEASDATILRHGDRYWMFAATRDGGAYSDALSLFHAPTLFGPWAAHEGNPVVIDRASARPAGNVVSRGGRLWRPVQDCTDRYGGALGLAEILRLDEGGFEQAVRQVLLPGPLWPGRRLHTLNRAGSLECIDGSVTVLKRALWF